MTDTKFYNDITTAVQKYLGEDWTAELLTNVTKNNGTNRVAMVLYKNDDKIRPQIYLENITKIINVEKNYRKSWRRC